MIRDLKIMDRIQRQKAKDIKKKGLRPLDPEGREMAKHKRFTLDMVGVPVDPLR